ncbi:hypothetical protein KQI63_08630 [bacterium]|nr:hypothetical protein [bacterium]
MRRSTRHTGMVIALLYLATSIGLVGCGDDDPEVYPPLVEPLFSAAITIQPDDTYHVTGHTFLQFRGGGNDMPVPEEDNTSGIGCFGGDDPDPVYEIGDYENIENAVVTLNGVQLFTDTYEKSGGWEPRQTAYWPGIPFDMPEDSFLVMSEGDTLFLEFDVPEEEESQLAPVPLRPNRPPHMPENFFEISLSDTLVLQEIIGYWINLRSLDQQRTALTRLDEWEEPNGDWYAHYLFEPWVTEGDTLLAVCDWTEKLPGSPWGHMLAYNELRYLLVVE